LARVSHGETEAAAFFRPAMDKGTRMVRGIHKGLRMMVALGMAGGLLFAVPAQAKTSRIKDIVNIEGVRDNSSSVTVSSSALTALAIPSTARPSPSRA
jgi:hypothetical protein